MGCAIITLPVGVFRVDKWHLPCAETDPRVVHANGPIICMGINGNESQAKKASKN